MSASAPLAPGYIHRPPEGHWNLNMDVFASHCFPVTFAFCIFIKYKINHFLLLSFTNNQSSPLPKKKKIPQLCPALLSSF